MSSNNVKDFSVNEENTSLLSWYASIMCRLAYDPPILYQLGLIEVLDILKNKGYLDQINAQIYAASFAENQQAFIKELEDKSKMKPLSVIAYEINNKLEQLHKTVYGNQGIPEPVKPTENDVELKGGAQKMTLDNLSTENLKKLEDSSESNIRTIFIQSNHDENLYITADKRTNSIYVTFRGTQSIKNSLSDANVMPYKGCDGNLLDQVNGGFSLKSMKESASKMSKKARAKASSMNKSLKNKFKSTEIKYFGGVASLVTSTLNTVMYSIIHLCKTFLHTRSPPDAAGQVQVFCFGHSLGGGLTTYFSWLFPGAYNKFTEDEKQYLKPSIVCISNASPRVFNLMTMKRYVDMMKQGMIKYLRQWTKGDWVAKVPQQKLGYYHPKDENDSSFITTFETAKYWNTSGMTRNFNKPLDGKFGASTGALGTSTSLAAHCWQQYIDFWPVVKGFTIGSDQTSKKEANKSGEKVTGKKITINLVLIGENDSVVKSINKNIGIESIDSREDNPKKKPLLLKIDSQVINYQWYLSNIINTLSDGNVSVSETPLQPVNNVPDAKGYNFATGTCTMYQNNITADANTPSPEAIINQKGGTMYYDSQGSGRWIGQNPSGRADAEFFNFLGIRDTIRYFDLWKYPNSPNGFMNSPWWSNENARQILNMLDNIVDVRAVDIDNAKRRGLRDNYEDKSSDDEGHTRVLTYILQLRRLIRDNQNVFFNRVDRGFINLPRNFNIEDTPGYAGVASEVSNRSNPSAYGEGGSKNKYRKKKSSKKSKRNTRKKYTRNKRKRGGKKSRSKNLPKLTRRTPYKKYT